MFFKLDSIVYFVYAFCVLNHKIALFRLSYLVIWELWKSLLSIKRERAMLWYLLVYAVLF